MEDGDVGMMLVTMATSSTMTMMATTWAQWQ
jgi:hypothetical protein